MWTSPVSSLSGIRYYVLFLDQFSHFLWVYPLRNKIDVFSKFLQCHTYVNTQFGKHIQSLQCDNVVEYNNSQFHDFFAKHGIRFCFSCPYTSQQNGRSERMIRTINNAVRTMLLQAHLPNTFWVEALNNVVHILNLHPSTLINNRIPFSVLFNKTPSYNHLRVFGSLCYPHTNTQNKLEPRSAPSAFLGYPLLHPGYRCFDMKTRKIMISRHVTFQEDILPLQATHTKIDSAYEFLEAETQLTQIQKCLLLTPSIPTVTATPPVQPAAPASILQPPQQMVIRSQQGIHKPKQILSLNA